MVCVAEWSESVRRLFVEQVNVGSNPTVHPKELRVLNNRFTIHFEDFDEDENPLWAVHDSLDPTYGFVGTQRECEEEWRLQTEAEEFVGDLDSLIDGVVGDVPDDRLPMTIDDFF